jgi:hypothetical protein
MADVKLIGNGSTSGSNTTAANTLAMQRFQAIKSGTVSKIWVRSAWTGNAMCAIYADSSGSAGDLIGSTASTAISAGDNYINLGSPVDIISGTYYWLAWIADVGYLYRKYSAGSGFAVYYKSATYSGFSFPNPAGTGYSTSADNNADVAGWGAEAVAGGRMCQVIII